MAIGGNSRRMRMDKVLLSIIAASGLFAVHAHVGHQYHFVYEQKNMTEALSYCREKYTDLATIESMDDVNLLNSLADRSQMIEPSGYNGRAWIGLYDDVNSWRWSLSDESFYKPGEKDFRNWYLGEPSNFHSKEHCAALYDTGKWNDNSCELYFRPICCHVKESNVTFVLISTPMSWTEAQSYCRKHHTDLASVRDMSENQKIKELLPAGQIVWIGLSRESWKWKDGSDSSFRFWAPAEPKNNHGNEACVAADFGNNGRWEDWQCHERRAVICNRALLVVKRVIKVRMAAPNPSLNLNDPAVMEKILKQLKQNLKNQGVNEDVKLSWRKQADGKVFHEEEEQEGTKDDK